MNLIVPEGFLHFTCFVFTVVMLPSSEVLAVAHIVHVALRNAKTSCRLGGRGKESGKRPGQKNTAELYIGCEDVIGFKVKDTTCTK